MAQLDTPRSGNTVSDAPVEFLSFRLDDAEYAIDILQVQEIRGYSAVTPVPNSPPYVKGMVNLRGMVVPVVGLRERFGMPSIPYDKFTVIVVVTVGTKVMGVVVDSVTDVLRVKRSDIDATPELGDRVDTSFVTGLAKSGERLVIILDVKRAVEDACNAAHEPDRN